MFLTIKSPGVTQRSISQENATKKAKPVAFFSHTIGSNYSFTLIEKKIQGFLVKFEFKVTPKGKIHPVVTPSDIFLFSFNS